jgi:hypothetical protein
MTRPGTGTSTGVAAGVPVMLQRGPEVVPAAPVHVLSIIHTIRNFTQPRFFSGSGGADPHLVVEVDRGSQLRLEHAGIEVHLLVLELVEGTQTRVEAGVGVLGGVVAVGAAAVVVVLVAVAVAAAVMVLLVLVLLLVVVQRPDLAVGLAQ